MQNLYFDVKEKIFKYLSIKDLDNIYKINEFKDVAEYEIIKRYKKFKFAEREATVDDMIYDMTHLTEVYDSFSDNSVRKYIFLDDNNKLHRSLGPALIDTKENTKEYYNHGKIIKKFKVYNDSRYEAYYNDDEKYEVCYKNDIKVSEAWYKNGKYHRDDDEPAFISYNDSGDVYMQQWYKNGELHRDNDEPAHIRILRNKVIDEQWYVDGELIKENHSF